MNFRNPHNLNCIRKDHFRFPTFAGTINIWYLQKAESKSWILDLSDLTELQKNSIVNEQGRFRTWQPTCTPTKSTQITNGSLPHISPCLHLTSAFASTSVSTFNIVFTVTQTLTQRMGWNPWIPHHSLNAKLDTKVDVDTKCKQTFTVGKSHQFFLPTNSFHWKDFSLFTFTGISHELLSNGRIYVSACNSPDLRVSLHWTIVNISFDVCRLHFDLIWWFFDHFRFRYRYLSV